MGRSPARDALGARGLAPARRSGLPRPRGAARRRPPGHPDAGLRRRRPDAARARRVAAADRVPRRTRAGFVTNTGCSDRARRPRRAPAGSDPRQSRAPRGADRPQPGRPLRPRARPPPPGPRLARDLDRRRAAPDARDQLSDPGGGRRRPPGRAPKRTRAVAALPDRDVRLPVRARTSSPRSRPTACA